MVRPGRCRSAGRRTCRSPPWAGPGGAGWGRGRWEAEIPAPRLRVLERRGAKAGALGVGDRILARTEQRGQGWAAHPMKKLMKGSELVLRAVHKDAQGLRPRPAA